MDTKETICMMALSRLGSFHLAEMKELYERVGSASAIMEHRKDIREIVDDAAPRLVELLQQSDAHLKRAEEEWDWDQKHGVQILCIDDEAYPRRLAECADAPLVLYYSGNANLNASHVASVVGTRHCTLYGQDLIRHFMQDLKDYEQDLLVVSGLAYGVDICAHRCALDNGFNTVAVLAHGLDDLYPSRHRDTAMKMRSQGGLLTEYMTGTNADKVNFVRRNRIVAGMSDVTVLVESAVKGGGMITCGIANSYSREVCAFPGAVGAVYSAGCNDLIRRNEASLITSAADFEEHMGWQDARKVAVAQQRGIERQMFPELTPEQQKIVDALQITNDLQINMLAAKTGLPIAKVTSELFELEMKGVVRSLPGAICHLLA